MCKDKALVQLSMYEKDIVINESIKVGSFDLTEGPCDSDCSPTSPVESQSAQDDDDEDEGRATAQAAWSGLAQLTDLLYGLNSSLNNYVFLKRF